MIRYIRLMMAGACVLLLPMCDQVEGPLPAGSVQATDAKADAMLQNAKNLRASGRLSKAQSVLKNLVQYHALAPCAPQARFMLGEILEQRNDPRAAFKQYGKIVESYQGSELYARALNRQLSIGTAAATGKLKGKVLWTWSVPMESDTVIEWLSTVVRNAPYADMSATASSVLGNYLMRQRKYDEACSVFQSLVEKYPDSPYAPTAQMMVAKLWAASHTRGNQNLVNLDKAREAYDEFVLRFPGHEETGAARKGSADMQKLMVQQELEVGRYYLERARQYDSAVFCFENVIRQKEHNPQAAAEAQKLLERAKEADNLLPLSY